MQIKKPIPTLVHTFFRDQELNRIFKSRFLTLPRFNTEKAPRRTSKQPPFPFLRIIFRRPRRRLFLVDLSALNDIPAVHLRRYPEKLVNITGRSSISFDKLDLEFMFKRQTALIEDLLREQQIVLSEQTKTIIAEERERRRKDFDAKQGKRTRT